MVSTPTALFIVVGLLSLVVTASDCPCDAGTNRSALMVLFLSTQGPRWALPPSIDPAWGTDLPVCTWPGLSCAGPLLNMQLQNYNLNGTLPSSLSEHLPNLGLVSIKVYIPQPLPTFAAAVNLKCIDLSGSFTGPLPETWSQLQRLMSVSVEAALVGGALPPTWASLTHLSSLSLFNVNVSGTLPAAWAAMVSMQSLTIRSPLLTGPIPSSWSAMAQLGTFDAAFSNLSGPLPASWSTLWRLEFVRLQGNRITGPLPASWGKLQSLYHLNLESNAIDGELPEAWGYLQAPLSYLLLDSNKLTGPIPASWDQLIGRMSQQADNTLFLSNNQLTGTPNICLFTVLNDYSISNNSFTGVPNMTCFQNGCNSYRFQDLTRDNHFCGRCSLPACPQCDVLHGMTVAQDASIAVLELSTASDCCAACRNTTSCAAGVFFTFDTYSYCELKNASTPLVAKEHHTVLRVYR